MSKKIKKVLYVILHGSINPQRYYNVKESWGKNVDCLFYSDHNDVDKNIIKVSDRTDYHSNEEKHINSLQYVSTNIKDYEWFFFCDDDTFVNTQKLEGLLDIFDKNSIHGSLLDEGHWPTDKSLNFCSGGAGYLIHSELLTNIIEHIKILNTGYSDVTLGLHLRTLNIKSINHNFFKSQPPSFFNIPINETKNYITFHYIKTIDEMKLLLENI
jgi:hypothetical protein